jgi:hypothetical protein
MLVGRGRLREEIGALSEARRASRRDRELCLDLLDEDRSKGIEGNMTISGVGINWVERGLSYVQDRDRKNRDRDYYGETPTPVKQKRMQSIASVIKAAEKRNSIGFDVWGVSLELGRGEKNWRKHGEWRNGMK